VRCDLVDLATAHAPTPIALAPTAPRARVLSFQWRLKTWSWAARPPALGQAGPAPRQAARVTAQMRNWRRSPQRKSHPLTDLTANARLRPTRRGERGLRSDRACAQAGFRLQARRPVRRRTSAHARLTGILPCRQPILETAWVSPARHALPVRLVRVLKLRTGPAKPSFAQDPLDWPRGTRPLKLQRLPALLRLHLLGCHPLRRRPPRPQLS